jgi:hypothetical protein
MIAESNGTVTGVPGPGAPLRVGTRNPFQSRDTCPVKYTGYTLSSEYKLSDV